MRLFVLLLVVALRSGAALHPPGSSALQRLSAATTPLALWPLPPPPPHPLSNHPLLSLRPLAPYRRGGQDKGPAGGWIRGAGGWGVGGGWATPCCPFLPPGGLILFQGRWHRKLIHETPPTTHRPAPLCIHPSLFNGRLSAFYHCTSFRRARGGYSAASQKRSG